MTTSVDGRSFWGALAMTGATVAVLRRASLRYGASGEEVGANLPGDELLSRVGLSATRAITIGAPAGEVWPWIAQLGQGRGGFYSYDAVENLVGCDIHSADQIVARWQDVEIGDQVHLAPAFGLTAVQVDQEQALVLRGGLPTTMTRTSPFDFTWAFVLRPEPDGTTRLVVRERYTYTHRWLAAVIEPIELVSFLMSRRMLLGIRHRVELRHRPGWPAVTELPDPEGGEARHRDGSDATLVRQRGDTVEPFPSSRRLVTAAVRAGRRIVPMHGLIDIDVTAALRRLDEHEPALSFTAFLVASVGRAAAVYPEVHAYREWRGRLVRHRHVDIQTLVEVSTDQGPLGLVHVVRDADVRSVASITAELRAIQADHTTTSAGRLLDTLAPVAGRIPGLFHLMFAVMGRSRRVHRASGTVQVTAVGMFGGGGGFAIAPPTLASLLIVIGGISKRPYVVDGQVEVRGIVDLTVTVDHNVVDGAPATRFTAELRRLIHTAAVLESAPPRAGSTIDTDTVT